MNKSKTKKLVSVAALVLCIAMAAVFAFAFAGCDEENASADSGLTWGQERGYVMGGGSTYKNDVGEDVYEEMPETLNSEIVEPVYVENPNATITGEFDKNGVAPCVYYNTKDSILNMEFSGYGCEMCNGECEGHDGYISYGGYAYRNYFYPYTIAPISTTAETVEIQCTLIFWDEPEVVDGVFSNFHYGANYIALSSITGEPLDVARVTEIPVVFYGAHETCGDYGYAAYSYEDNGGYRRSSSYVGAYNVGGMEKDAQDLYPTKGVTCSSYCVYSVELANGDVYEYGVKYFDPSDPMLIR